MPLFDFPKLTIGVVVLFCIFVPMERLFTLRPARIFRAGFLADTLHFFISGGLRKLLTLLAALLIIRALGFLIYPPLQHWISALPWLAQFAIAFVVQDVGAYWGHRTMHTVPWLWPFHAVHHSSEHLDWMAANRVHPVDQTIIRSFGFVPLYLLGFDKTIFAGVATFETLWAIFIHANVRWRFGGLEWLISTPAFHHWHHADERMHYNKNYSAFLPWVDAIFGTLHLPKDRMPSRYGIGTNMTTNYLAQLAYPFRRKQQPILAATSRRADEVVAAHPSSAAHPFDAARWDGHSQR